MLIFSFLNFLTFAVSKEKLVLHDTYIPGMNPIIEYKGKYISLIDSDSVYLSIKDFIIEENINVSIQINTSTLIPWNLDTLDNKIDGNYEYIYDGTGTNVYVIDSGIFVSTDFGSSIKNGMSFVYGYNYTYDCLGHGTHVSSIIGSKTYGVSKGVTIIPVKIFDCIKTTSLLTVLKAIYWVIKQPKGIVNLSLGGDHSFIFNNAIKDLINAGFIVVSAAGNNGLDACNYSPSSEPNSIVVGCTNSEKMVCSFSNEGNCVTLFAPGQSIMGLSNYQGQNIRMSGTSMSAPHVTGVAATIYSKYPGITQKEVKKIITSISVNNTLSKFKFGGPNLEIRVFKEDIKNVCNKVYGIYECKNTLLCIYINNYGCRVYNFCGFKTKKECLSRKRCKFVSGKCTLSTPKDS